MLLRNRRLLPIVQGGMGVGISAHRLAGTVAREGAVGTIASIDLRRLHPDLIGRTRGSRDIAEVDEANREGLDREIRAARAICGQQGFLAVNVMKAVRQHPDLVRQACKSGADAIVMGAGLPLDLPELAEGYPEVGLIPILSESRGVRAVLRKWARKGRTPLAIVIELPRSAGGHLGSPRLEEVADPRYEFERVLAEVGDVFRELDMEPVPLIAAGGVNTHEKLVALLDAGWSAAQIGTPFAVTVEGDADPKFKAVLAGARPQDIVTFQSGAGLPARAVLTPWLRKYLGQEEKLRARAGPATANCVMGLECLTFCGLKDGDPHGGQFCIAAQLAAARRGDVAKGLFFRGAERLPFGDQIRPVRELLDFLLTGSAPAGVAAAG